MAFLEYFKLQPPEPIPLFEKPPLPLEALRNLFAWLARPEAPPCAHAHKDTIHFLLDHDLPVEPVLRWLRAHGGICDCRVASDLASRWERDAP